MSECQAGRLDITETHVAIYDSRGEEVIYWDRAEWTADPNVATQIFRMINLFHTLGLDRLRDALSTATYAAKGLAAYAEAKDQTDEDPETTVQDFLTDLRHFCDGHGYDFHALVDRGYGNYDAERRSALWAGRAGRGEGGGDG